MEIADLLLLATSAAYMGGGLLQEKYLKVEDVREKTDITDLVTEADKEAERLIRDYLLRHLPPDHSIVGEEGGGDSKGEFVWYVDPLDGTANFAKGVPLFSVSIGVLKGETFLAGVVYHPSQDTIYWGGSNIPVRINGKVLKPSFERSIKGSYVGLGFPRRCSQRAKEAALLFQQYSSLHARKLRSIGSAALGLAWVAAGFLDVYFQPCLSMWDMAGGVPLVLGIGGSVYIHEVDDHTYGVWASGNSQLYHQYAEIIPYLNSYKPIV